MMQVKRYVAPSYAEALIKAKNELGTNAMIVESKKLQVGGFFGLFARTMTELIVAVDQADTPKPPPAQMPARPTAPVPVGPAASGVEQELAALKVAVTRLVDRDAAAGLTGFARKAYTALMNRGVDEGVALGISSRLPAAEQEGRTAFRQEIARLLGPVEPIAAASGQRKVVALVGPTGVGKTTTLAKLAAEFTLDHGLKVGLITADTYRIAAVEQLRTYAEILGIPLHTVDTREDMELALAATAGCDLILADTAGRSHKDAQRMLELKETLAILRPNETHLVFSLAANPKDAFEALERYLPLGVNRLSFTKLDETSAPGLLLNLRSRCKQPLAYITYGQSVPEDIMTADRADITKILLGA